MKKSLILYVLGVLVITLVMAACAKKQAPDTPYTKILGRWKLAKFGSDDNGNGTIEKSEISNQPSSQDRELLFKNDGTGVETDVNNGEREPDLAFDWGIIKADSLILTYKAHDTLTYFLVNITSGDLTMTQSTDQGLLWFYYIKK